MACRVVVSARLLWAMCTRCGLPLEATWLRPGTANTALVLRCSTARLMTSTAWALASRLSCASLSALLLRLPLFWYSTSDGRSCSTWKDAPTCTGPRDDKLPVDGRLLPWIRCTSPAVRYQGAGFGDWARTAGRAADRVSWASLQSSPVACCTSAS